MQVLTGNVRNLGGGFNVARVLPQPARRAVGPFVFFDHFGPVEMPPGGGIDVRPHPHIGLATVTYLFEGAILHRDSLGNVQPIVPEEVNWMTAGRFIVHSERTPEDVRARGHRIHGIQSWVGLPQAGEECAPSFVHAGAEALPTKRLGGAELRLVVGSAYGLTVAIPVHSPIFYVDARISPGAVLPLTDEYAERAAFVVEGAVECGGAHHGRGAMLLFDANERATLSASAPARIMLLGGAPLDGSRTVWWNFVASSQDKIERAKEKWRANPTGHIKGDGEFIPLPD